MLMCPSKSPCKDEPKYNTQKDKSYLFYQAETNQPVDSYKKETHSLTYKTTNLTFLLYQAERRNSQKVAFIQETNKKTSSLNTKPTNLTFSLYQAEM